MPSTRNIGGNGGMLRKRDGTILGLEFSLTNPFFDGKPAPKLAPGQKKSDFQWVYALLNIQEDGKEPMRRALKVGGVDDFEIVLDGAGVSGTKPFNKRMEFGAFLDSLYRPLDEGQGIAEDFFPEDPEGLVADFTNIAGTRVMFDWIPDESDYGKKHPRKAKNKDGSPLMKDGKQVTYPAELLVVRSYYGQVDVDEAPASKPKPGGAAARSAATTAAKKAAAKPTVDIAALAGEKVVAALKKLKPVEEDGVKTYNLNIKKLSVKLLQELAEQQYADTREPVRVWALDGANCASIEGVSFDKDSQVVSYEAPEAE